MKVLLILAVCIVTVSSTHSHGWDAPPQPHPIEEVIGTLKTLKSSILSLLLAPLTKSKGPPPPPKLLGWAPPSPPSKYQGWAAPPPPPKHQSWAPPPPQRQVWAAPPPQRQSWSAPAPPPKNQGWGAPSPPQNHRGWGHQQSNRIVVERLQRDGGGW